MSTFEYVDAAGKAHTLVASSPTKAAQAVARIEIDRTGSVALAYRAVGTIEPVSLAGTSYPGSPSIARQ